MSLDNIRDGNAYSIAGTYYVANRDLAIVIGHNGAFGADACDLRIGSGVTADGNVVAVAWMETNGDPVLIATAQPNGIVGLNGLEWVGQPEITEWIMDKDFTWLRAELIDTLCITEIAYPVCEREYLDITDGPDSPGYPD